MKPRKKVLPPKLSHYFSFDKKFEHFNNNLYFNTQVFNGFTFFCALIIASSVLGFYKPIFWALGAGLLVLLIFLYQKTARLCEGVMIRRQIPKYSREKSEIEVSYLISNETGFSLKDLSFTDEFTGVSLGHFEVRAPKTIRPQAQIKIVQKIFLDAGMGLKSFEPIKLRLVDELGIFDFKVEFLQNQELEVYPFVEKTPSFKNLVSPDSTHFGFYEVAQRGDSNLFIGTREYRRGDPVKLINWRLTKKSDKVVVNEYEKSTNTFVTLLLELDLKNQMGIGGASTWELAKDLALSICHNEIRKCNWVQVISHDLYIPFGTGKQQIGVFEKHFTYHELKESKTQNHLRYLSGLPSKGQVYFICPSLFTPETVETIERLKRLRVEGQRVIIFILDPIQHIVQSVQGKLKLSMLETKRHADEVYKKLEKDLKKHGIPLVPVTFDEKKTLSDQVLASARQLVELK